MDKNHWVKSLAVILSFIFVTGPGALESWLSLIDRFHADANGGAKMTLNLGSFQDIYKFAFPILGFVILLFGIWWTRPKKQAGPPSGTVLSHIENTGVNPPFTKITKEVKKL